MFSILTPMGSQKRNRRRIDIILKKNMVLSALESVVKELDYYFNFQQTRKEKYEQIAHFLLFVLSFIFTKKEKQIESLLFSMQNEKICFFIKNTELHLLGLLSKSVAFFKSLLLHADAVEAAVGFRNSVIDYAPFPLHSSFEVKLGILMKNVRRTEEEYFEVENESRSCNLFLTVMRSLLEKKDLASPHALGSYEA